MLRKDFEIGKNFRLRRADHNKIFLTTDIALLCGLSYLLPVTNGGKLFKMTVLEAQTELEGILPDLGFSPIVFFF